MKFAFQRYKVHAEKLWLLEVGVSELFFCVFPAKIPAKRGKPPANRELRLEVGVVVFLMNPGSRIKSQQAGRNSRVKAIVREEKRIRFSASFPYFFFCLCAHGKRSSQRWFSTFLVSSESLRYPLS